jgi:hypothetical protein
MTVQPLDLNSIFVENFAGSGVYFIIIALIFIVWGAGKFRMTGVVMGMMAGLFIMLFAQTAYALYVLFILIFSLMAYLILSRMWSR